MRRTILLTIGFIVTFYLYASAAEHSTPIKLKFSEEALKKEMASGEMMTLPEFEIFNKKGNGIYHVTGFEDSFQGDVRNILMHPSSTEKTIDETLSKLRTQYDKPVDNSVFDGADFVFVEYWAEWCPSCFHQMRSVEGIVSSFPDLHIVWLKVEKDPAKLKSMNVKMLKKK